MNAVEPAVEVRLATPDDAEAVAAVLRVAFEPLRPQYTPAAYAATTPPAAEVRRRLSEGPAWVALLGGRMVGTVAAVPRGAGLYVRSMAVLPEARGRGVGAELLRRVEGHARAAGHGHLVLSTTPFLREAIRLYERTGFRRTSDGPHELRGTPLFTMVKDLPFPA